jgi:hypothetical protein
MALHGSDTIKIVILQNKHRYFLGTLLANHVTMKPKVSGKCMV